MGKAEMEYDAEGRRTVKRSFAWTGSAWQLVKTTRFVYDGWALSAEYETPVGGTEQIARSYTWGLGGLAGGLLTVTDHTGASPKMYRAIHDGSGNVVALSDVATGALAASFRYDAWGNILSATGIAANACPIDWGGGYRDAETGLVYLAHRYYSPQQGRFITRDPAAEAGGYNLYAYAGNDPVNKVDPTGLEPGDVAEFEKAIELIRQGPPAVPPEPKGESYGPREYRVDLQRFHSLHDAYVRNRLWEVKIDYDKFMADAGMPSRFFAIRGGKDTPDYDPTIVWPKSREEAELDEWQEVLMNVSFVEPTPFSDLANMGISLYRGDAAGAGMYLGSALFSEIPGAAAELAAGRSLFRDGFAADARMVNRASHQVAGAPPLLSLSSGESKVLSLNNPVRRAEGESRFITLNDPNCFVAGTPVLMADGSTKAIEDVEEGDWVLADDPDDGLPAGPHEVTAWHLNWTEHLTEVFVDADGNGTPDGSIEATRAHPFWTRNRGWVDAEDLLPGDLLLDASGQASCVTATRSIDAVEPVFNLSVNDVHTFFVMAGAEPVLVHNTAPGERMWIVYQANDASGKVYTGRASAPAGMFENPIDVLSYRYGSLETEKLRGLNLKEARIVYDAVGDGTTSKAYRAARGLEHLWDQRARAVGMSLNDINPIGPRNKNISGYLAEAIASGFAPC